MPLKVSRETRVRYNLSVGAWIALLAGATALAQGLPRGDSQSANLPNWQAPPRYANLNLQAGFEPDPREVPVQAGGSTEAVSIRPDCAGWIDFTRPDVDLNYQAGRFVLYISATSQADTTLVINDPSGAWHCNDNLVGRDPGVVFQRPLPGNYNIWVGTVVRGVVPPATVRVSEVLPAQITQRPTAGVSPVTPGSNPVTGPAPNSPPGAQATPAAPGTAPLATPGAVVGRAERIIVEPPTAQVGDRLLVTLQNFPRPNSDIIVVVPANTPDSELGQAGPRPLFQQTIYSAPTQPIEIGPFAPGNYEIRYLTTLYNNEGRREVSARTAFAVR